MFICENKTKVMLSIYSNYQGSIITGNCPLLATVITLVRPCWTGVCTNLPGPFSRKMTLDSGKKFEPLMTISSPPLTKQLVRLHLSTWGSS